MCAVLPCEGGSSTSRATWEFPTQTTTCTVLQRGLATTPASRRWSAESGACFPVRELRGMRLGRVCEPLRSRRGSSADIGRHSSSLMVNEGPQKGVKGVNPSQAEGSRHNSHSAFGQSVLRSLHTDQHRLGECRHVSPESFPASLRSDPQR